MLLRMLLHVRMLMRMRMRLLMHMRILVLKLVRMRVLMLLVHVLRNLRNRRHRNTRPFRTFFDQGLVKFAPLASVNNSPTLIAVVLQAGDVSAKERGEFSAAFVALAFVAHLIVQNVRLNFDSFIDFAVLQLHESCANGRDIALRVAESDSPGAFRIL